MGLGTFAIVLLALIVALAHTVETVTGFGSTVIALALGAQLVPVEELVVTLVILSLFQSFYLVWRNWSQIRWDILGKKILPSAGVGFPIGMWCSQELDNRQLKILLGMFVIGVALLELFRLLRPGAQSKPLARPLAWAVLGGGGFFHGLFASGGPLIVYYTSRQITEKGSFRVTLSALWLGLGFLLMGSFAFEGRIVEKTLGLAAWCLPGLALGILVGEILHVKVNDAAFRKVVQILLLVIGVFLVI